MPLLERDNRRVALTTAGAAFLDEARRLLALADAAPGLARRVSAGPAGWCASGSPPSRPQRARRRAREPETGELPDVDVDLQEMVTATRCRRCRTGSSTWPGRGPRSTRRLFDSRLLHREALLVALPAGHRLARLDRPLAGADLADEP